MSTTVPGLRADHSLSTSWSTPTHVLTARQHPQH